MARKELIYVPKNAHFEIMGKRCKTKRKLEDDNDVTITVPRRSDKSQQIKIVGSMKGIRECIVGIEDVIGFKVSKKPLVMVQISVPKDKHGLIIGKKAATLKSIEKETNCNIVVPRSNSKSTIVQVDGPEESINDAVKKIENLVGDIQVKKGGDLLQKLKVIDIDSKEDITEVLFFPDTDRTDGHNMDTFLKYLESAEKSMDICVFTLTNNAIANVLRRHHKNGVKVRIITDNDTSMAKGSDIEKLYNLGIPVKVDDSPYHMHNKFAVLDECFVVNGSFNWTVSAAKNNFENIVCTNNKTLVEEFNDQFKEMWADKNKVLIEFCDFEPKENAGHFH